MSNRVSESIFSGKTVIIPMADVSHVHKHWYSTDEVKDESTIRGYNVIMKHTTYDNEADFWANAAYLSKEEGRAFLAAWGYYRYELEGGEDAFKKPTLTEFEVCPSCGEKMPEGCGGKFKNDNGKACWLNRE